jgi:hypothetical protein
VPGQADRRAESAYERSISGSFWPRSSCSDRLAGERKLLLGIVAVLVAATVGVALDKGFADNIPPYDEPVVAQIGAATFGLCTLGSIVLAVIAVARAARSRPRPPADRRADPG